MYDATNEPREFIGEGRAEAVAMACEFFGADEEALVITELKPGEVYGLANRAVVVAVPRDRPPPPRERARGDAPGRRGRERNDAASGRDERGDASAASAASAGIAASGDGARDRGERRDASAASGPGGRRRGQRSRRSPRSERCLARSATWARSCAA